jgi:hypothetical protein
MRFPKAFGKRIRSLVKIRGCNKMDAAQAY